MLWGMVLRLERYLMDGVLLVCDMWNGIMCQIGQCIVCCLFLIVCYLVCVFPLPALAFGVGWYLMSTITGLACFWSSVWTILDGLCDMFGPFFMAG